MYAVIAMNQTRPLSSRRLLVLVLLVPFAASCRSAWSSPNANAIATLIGDAGYVRIEPGDFLMGAPKEETAIAGAERETGFRERPRHRVAITRAFEIGKYEVTQRQWEAVMGSNPSAFKGIELPVTNVSWNDVQEFLTRLQPLDGKHRYRLPTEAEWEMASRADGTGETSADALQETAWFDANSLSRPHPVGRLKPNAWGLHDMQGNVWEWVEDWYDRYYYKTSPAEDPSGPPAGQSKVQRGGSWQSGAWQCRPAARGYSLPAERNHLTGFRLVRVKQL
ncbi:MAG: formylglycine-generating enzyme family protein [Blastocatellia bacterium]